MGVVTFSEAQLMAWISPVFWPFLRILTVFTVAPVLSNRATPVRVRVALSFIIALAVRSALPEGGFPPLDGPQVVGVLMQQLLIGLAIGFAVRLVLASVELAGELSGLQMGLNFASFFDPVSGGQSSAVARFLAQMAALLFVVLNGHFLVASAVVRSFERFPADGQALESLRRLPLHLLGADVFAYGLWIALPMVGILLFVNIALGFLSRIAPQMNVFAIGFPVTLMAGLVGMAATLPMLERPFVRLTERAIAAVLGA